MKLNHVIESQQFTVPLLMELFDRTPVSYTHLTLPTIYSV